MNATKLKGARSNRWYPNYFGGMGVENYQIAVGVAIAIVVAGVLFFFLQVVGVGLGIMCGYWAASALNRMNTHHQDPKKYLQGQVKKRLDRRTLLINDRPASEPADEREQYVISVSEFPPT